MKKILLAIFLQTILFNIFSNAQTSGPWQRPLIICNSFDGHNFSNFQTFQDSSGVPSVIRDTTGCLIAAFQWFPAPMQGAHWDSVALKYSYDNGLTWTYPQTVYITNFPVGYQRIFDPALCLNADGSIRIYFSSSPFGGIVSTYSALSPDGINFTFEPGIRFTRTTQNTIDPTVIYFNGKYHYSAPKGAPQDGAIHATSTDGLNFIQQPDILSNTQHNWTGNFMIDSLAIKFYGTPSAGSSNLWFKDSPDAFAWNPNYIITNVQGGDPSCVKTGFASYIMIYTGPPYITGTVELQGENTLMIYPNPAATEIKIIHPSMSNFETEIVNVFGQVLIKSKNESVTDVSKLNQGIYFLNIRQGETLYKQKFIKQ